MKNDPRVWSTLPPADFGLLNDLSEVVAKWESENPGFLPSIGDGPILLLASDYGGQHRDARFETFSFLVADWIYLWLWDEMRREVRRAILPERTMGYKNLHDGVRRRALAPFLRAANVIPGLLFTVALDKMTRSKIIHAENETMEDGRIWKAPSLERLALIAGIATVLVAGLSDNASPGQHILWVTDQDEIIPNKRRSRDSLDILARFMHRWVPQDIGDVFWSIPTSKGTDYQNEDILSLPDLASGAIADFLTKSSFASDGQGSDSEVQHTLLSPLSEKTEAILDWYEEGQHPLKRMVVVVDEAPSGSYKLWVPDLSSSAGFKPDFDWREEALSRIAARNLKWESSEIGQKLSSEEAHDRARLLLGAIRKLEVKLGDPEATVRLMRDRS